MTVVEVLRAAATRLGSASASPRLDAEVLLAHVLKKPRGGLLAGSDESLPENAAAQFNALLLRRLQGEPVAYLIGHWEFWSLPLKITPEVLVPRPETELLVQWSLEISRASHLQHIADLGTGSGAIAFALAKELPGAHVIAVDRSAGALALARANGAALRLANVVFFQEDFAAFFADTGVQGGMFDLIVSNPPYIAEGDPHLRNLVHEPSGALMAGADGLASLRVIVAGALARLKAGGWLLVEHGWEQAAAVRELMQHSGLERIETRRDLAGLERATGGRAP